MSECCVCYDQRPPVHLHSCNHAVCAECTITMIRHGHHFNCPYCRAELQFNFTIGISTVTNHMGAMLDDDGDGILIRGNSLEVIRGCTNPARLGMRLGRHTATVARLQGRTILYGAVVPTLPRYLDCFFQVPLSSEDSRRGRALRRRLMLENIDATTLNEEKIPLFLLMKTLVFPVALIDVIDPPELEVDDVDFVV